MDMTALSGGFSDAPRVASFAFRAIMNAMARPGRIECLEGATPPAPLNIATGTLLLTLADPDTPVHLAGDTDRAEVRDWLGFHTGATAVGPGKATFAVGAWDALMPLDAYAIGTPEYPDKSATLIVDVDTLSDAGSTLSGPGIQTTATLSLPDPNAIAANNARFPLGLDFFFTCGTQIVGLPRSTRIS